MRFAAANFEQVLLTELRRAQSAKIAVAYFNPHDNLLTALRGVADLRLIVSGEFELNNPYKLQRLSETAQVRMVRPDAETGKLHAKVFLVARADGSRWGLIGSANLTRPGMLSNQEAGVILDSSEAQHESLLTEIDTWFEQIDQQTEVINFALAQRVFDARAGYRVRRAAVAPLEPQAAPGYWALKTTEGPHGPKHWDDFIAENVVAIGWPQAQVDPTGVTRQEFEEALKRGYPGEDEKFAARKILQFVGLAVGDVVLVCRGYNSEQNTDVHIFGVARVTGPFRYDPNSNWWIYKRAADLRIINQRLPVEAVRVALGKQSLMQTLHTLTREEFERFAALARETLSVVIDPDFSNLGPY